MYKLFDYHGKVYPVLELSTDVPSEQAQKRWLGEPIRAVILPTKIFTTNAKGFPVLSTAHQLFIIKLIKVIRGEIIDLHFGFSFSLKCSLLSKVLIQKIRLYSNRIYSILNISHV